MILIERANSSGQLQSRETRRAVFSRTRASLALAKEKPFYLLFGAEHRSYSYLSANLRSPAVEHNPLAPFRWSRVRVSDAESLLSRMDDMRIWCSSCSLICFRMVWLWWRWNCIAGLLCCSYSGVLGSVLCSCMSVEIHMLACRIRTTSTFLSFFIFFGPEGVIWIFYIQTRSLSSLISTLFSSRQQQ